MKESFKSLIGIVCIALITISISSCEDDNDDPMNGSNPGSDTTGVSDFSRSEMLEEMAENLIIPNLTAFQSRINELSEATSTFVNNTTETNLVAVQASWVQAATDFQHCSAYGFGPGLLPLGTFASVLGAFPVDETLVEQHILDPDFSLPASFDRDIRGLYTVEYLLYGRDGDNATIVTQFDQERKDYLNLIVSELKTTMDGIVEEWNTTYLTEFVASDGTSAGSSITLLYNEFVKDYENLKNFKVELPAGLTAGQTSTEPERVEAFYSGISLDLIEEHFQSSENIWLGRTRDGQDIVGFEEYLESVVGGPELIETTKTAISTIDNAIAAVPEGRLSDNVATSEVEILRDELQANTPNFKSSMSSLLGIAITFNSGDGD